MRSYWESRAQLNAAWYVDTTLEFEDPDMERFFEGGERTISTVLDSSPRLPPASGTAIEIGSGLGRMCLALSRRYERVVGLDISEGMARRARDLVRDRRISFVVTDGSTLSALADASADLLFSFTVFQHIPDRTVVDRYILEIGRVLKPGGLLILQWNNQPNAWRWALRRRAARLLDRLGVQKDRYGRFAAPFMGSRIPFRRIRRSLNAANLMVLKTKDLGSLFAWVWAERRRTEVADDAR